MIYKALLTDEFLSHFRLDDNGKTLVLTDKTGLTRAVMLEAERHGEWIKSNPLTDTFECSLCGMQIPVPEMCSPYCPLCGADMKGGI